MGRRSDRRTKWIGVGVMLAVGGCTDGGAAPGLDLDEDLELLAEPADARAPTTSIIPLGLALDPVALEVGDFDGDGNMDVLIAGVEAGVGVRAAIMLGDGAGGFGAPFDPGFSGCSAYPLVGDITGDGRTDVITSGCANDLNVFEAQSDGTLLPWSAWPAIEYSSVRGSVVTDFERDGDADLISLSVPDSAYINVTLGNGGEGIWGVQTSEIGDPSWSTFDPNSLVAGHFDADGLVDVALIDRDHDVATLRGIAPANYAFPRELGVDVIPWSLRAGDLDNDALTDLVVSSYDDTAVQVMRVSAATGQFVAVSPVSLDGFAPYDTAVGDLDGDGDIDVAMVSETSARTIWLTGDGSGALTLANRADLPSPAIRVHVADFDNDGAGDIVAATYDDDSITLVLGVGS